MNATPPDMDLNSTIQESIGHYQDFLRKLLQIPTERMREQEAVQFLAKAFKGSGCEVEVFQGKGIGEPIPDGAPINIFARRKGSGEGKSLLLGAHLDTIPTGDASRWSHAPWSGDVVDGRIYARGAHDDRSGAALLWMVADLLEKSKSRTAGDLNFLVTTEEEYSAGGMKAFLERADRICPDAYLMVDGNSSGECILGHPGALSFEIEIRGPYRTAQEPATVHEGNAIELMAALITDFRSFEAQIQKKLRELGADARWPNAIIAMSDITSNGWISNVPESCTVKGFCNVFPPLTLEQYKAYFEFFAKGISSRHAWLKSCPPTISWGPLEVPALVVSNGSPFYQALTRAHLASYGTELRGRFIGGWGDPRLLNCPETIFYGPGGGGGDHTYDEYFELKDLDPMLRVLTRLIFEWCGCHSEENSSAKRRAEGAPSKRRSGYPPKPTAKAD